ncbi:MAG TPA: hypothetical protein VIG25_03430 [Pyrinomonadaceae bacterium]|jgi:hypothetical protein
MLSLKFKLEVVQMKHVTLALFICFSLSLCNLSNRLKKTSGPGSESTSDGGITAEKAVPTAAQSAAIAGGEKAVWDVQGMSWTVPANWTETSKELNSFLWRSPGGSDAASLIVSISPMDESFPTDISIKSYYDQQKTRSKNGEVDEFKWVEIDGLKGVQFREVNPPRPDDIRRLQWLAYRKFAGQVQFVNVMLASSAKGFSQHQDAMYGVLYSMKLVH